MLRSADSDSQEGGGSDTASSSSSNRDIVLRPSGNSDESDKNNSSPAMSKKRELDWDTPGMSKHCLYRRPSKDDSTLSSNSDSPQSGDEYTVYFYNSKDMDELNSSAQRESKSADTTQSGTLFANLKLCDDPWDVLFARAEGLHAHGHSREACMLGVTLAEELLANPPDLMIEIPVIPKRKGKKPQVSC